MNMFQSIVYLDLLLLGWVLIYAIRLLGRVIIWMDIRVLAPRRTHTNLWTQWQLSELQRRETMASGPAPDED